MEESPDLEENQKVKIIIEIINTIPKKFTKFSFFKKSPLKYLTIKQVKIITHIAKINNVEKECNAYPGYIFIYMEYNRFLIRTINKINGVIGFITKGRQLMPIVNPMSAEFKQYLNEPYLNKSCLHVGVKVYI